MTQDAVWLWGASHGCRRVTYREGHFSSTAFTVQNGALKSNNIHFVRQFGGKIWIGTQQGVYYWHVNMLVAVDENHSFRKILSYDDKMVIVTSAGELLCFNNKRKWLQ